MSGYGDLHCACYVLLQVADKTAARHWIGQLADQIATGERPQKVAAVNLAVTYRGLEKLGLDKEALDGFSRPFSEGMATTHRSRILGDDDENAPEKWNWGGNDANAVDLLLLLFAENETLLANVRAEKKAEFAAGGVVEVQILEAGRQPDSHEHFGFADGMGQPAIEGTFQAEKSFPRNIIKAGELLLGYVNDYDKPADSPLVKAALDPHGRLLQPRVIDDVKVAKTNQADLRDLGLNGTYLVFRQLAQDTVRFTHFVDQATRGLDGQLDRKASDQLAAKFVGRWQSGAPLEIGRAHV